ncbi:hypothetical protein Vi05172_g8877 [Venturia inaequalis]|nr:hypothetical protein Vi05172_g8877 [Venturia inaequalis]
MASIYQLLRFTLPRSNAALLSTFQALRDRVSNDSVKTQYFGYMIPNEGFPDRTAENDMCWVIKWPQSSTFQKSAEFKAALSTIGEGNIRSSFFDFQETKEGDTEKGFEAPVCQFALISLHPTAPKCTPKFTHSMSKTFTDCYHAPGFRGGAWAYSPTTNSADGQLITDPPTPHLEEKERRLACYVLGWEDLEAHHSYAKTPLFDEEIDYLMEWFDKGTGAFYVRFEKHV